MNQKTKEREFVSVHLIDLEHRREQKIDNLEVEFDFNVNDKYSNHYAMLEWGFVHELVAHIYKALGEQDINTKKIVDMERGDDDEIIFYLEDATEYDVMFAHAEARSLPKFAAANGGDCANIDCDAKIDSEHFNFYDESYLVS